MPLANMTGLKLLNVSHNNLTEIPRGSVPKLYYLHTVDFSYNRLTTIAAVVFQVVFGLRTMLFQHNELEELTYGTLGSLPTVLHLDLSHNRFVIFKYTVVIIPILHSSDFYSVKKTIIFVYGLKGAYPCHKRLNSPIQIHTNTQCHKKVWLTVYFWVLHTIWMYIKGHHFKTKHNFMFY